MAATSPRPFFSSRFFISLVSLALVLIALGGSVFRYLTSSAQTVAVQARPIAIATTFVPASSPFTVSLLTSPNALLGTSVEETARQQSPSRTQQIKQRLLDSAELDYERDVQPWIGGEVTLTLVDSDLDADSANGQDAGYLITAAIAPGHQNEAREVLRQLWTKRSLAGRIPARKQTNGVRLLYETRPDLLSAASAIVGNRFVLFANDVRVLERSLQAAQSATNLAQDRLYRDTVATLPNRRIGLAYVQGNLIETDEIDAAENTHARTALSFDSAAGGLTTLLQTTDKQTGLSDLKRRKPSDGMDFLPPDAVWALTGKRLQDIASELRAANLQTDLPRFLTQDGLGENETIWDWAKQGYAIGKVGSDWILAVKRDEEGVAALDEAARRSGYSTVPVILSGESGRQKPSAARTENAEAEAVSTETLEIENLEQEAVAWTQLKTKRGSSARSSSGLTTEILGLHVRQGEYEVFTSSVEAMVRSLSVLEDSLLSSAEFQQAAEKLPPSNSGYLYASKPVAAQIVDKQLSKAQRINQFLAPLFSNIRSMIATRSTSSDGETASVFIAL